MKQNKLVLSLTVLLTVICMVCSAAAQQAMPTASRALELSAFGGISGDYTGFNGGKNGSLSAGVDLAFKPYYGLRPTLEARGFYPIDKGTIVSQKAGMGGLRVDFLLGHRARPYADFLFGRGEMDYAPPVPSFNGWQYSVSTTNVQSPGAGIDYNLTPRFAIKLDAQYQIWGSTPTASTKVHSTVGTIGVVYRFGQRAAL